jgi:hypothetical protein
MRDYIILLGSSNCSTCGKNIKKIYKYKNKDYGSECIKKELGISDVSDEALSIPPWLLLVAEKYIQYRIERDPELKNIEHGDDFATNFYNYEFGIEMKLVDKNGLALVDNNKTIKIDGKPVKRDWQIELFYYLVQRRNQIKPE